MKTIGSGILSWIKHAVQEYSEELYQSMYHEKDPIKKTFCFAPILPKPKFDNHQIELSGNYIQIIFSFYNYNYAFRIYNSFVGQLHKKFHLNRNSMTLIQAYILPEEDIQTSKIKIKLSSPMIVRKHDRETRKDTYYCFEREDFKTYLHINILEQMKAEGLDASLLDGFEIKPIQAKKVVMPVYEKMIECSIGSFELVGKKELLNYLYRAGMGAKKGLGFGLFNLIS